MSSLPSEADMLPSPVSVRFVPAKTGNKAQPCGRALLRSSVTAFRYRKANRYYHGHFQANRRWDGGGCCCCSRRWDSA